MRGYLRRTAGETILIILFMIDTILLRQMLETASSSGVELRGQTKTHKTVEGGIIQTGGTKKKIVTSTLIEVAYIYYLYILCFIVKS